MLDEIQNLNIEIDALNKLIDEKEIRIKKLSDDYILNNEVGKYYKETYDDSDSIYLYKILSVEQKKSDVVAKVNCISNRNSPNKRINTIFGEIKIELNTDYYGLSRKLRGHSNFTELSEDEFKVELSMIIDKCNTIINDNYFLSSHENNGLPLNNKSFDLAMSKLNAMKDKYYKVIYGKGEGVEFHKMVGYYFLPDYEGCGWGDLYCVTNSVSCNELELNSNWYASNSIIGDNHKWYDSVEEVSEDEYMNVFNDFISSLENKICL